MKKVWIHKSNSFEEAEKFENKYYCSMTKKERLDTMQYLRELYYHFKTKRYKNASRKRLQRIITVVQ